MYMFRPQPNAGAKPGKACLILTRLHAIIIQQLIDYKSNKNRVSITSIEILITSVEILIASL